jgi:anti-anti-sigma factor
MGLRCTMHRIGDEPTIVIEGLADLSTAPRLHAFLRDAITEHAGRTLIVNLNGVTTLDDAALGLLLGAAARSRELGGDVEIVCTDERLRQRLSATRVDQPMRLHTSVAARRSSQADRGDTFAPFTAVIFTNQRSEDADDDDGYEAAAAHMEALAAEQPGFRGIDSVRNPDGFGVTVSYWATDADAQTWKRNGEHLAAQRTGRDRWYSWYRVQVATVRREYSYDRVDGPSCDHADPG